MMVMVGDDGDGDGDNLGYISGCYLCLVDGQPLSAQVGEGEVELVWKKPGGAKLKESDYLGWQQLKRGVESLDNEYCYTTHIREPALQVEESYVSTSPMTS